MTPENAVALAVQHFKAGRFAEAQRLCRGVLAKDPRQLDALQLESVLEATAGRVESAIQIITQAISINPNAADYYLNLGEYQRRGGQLDAAITTIERAIGLEPRHAVAHFNLGVVLAEQGKNQQAMAEYERAVALQPDLAEAHLMIGNELRRQGQFDEALASFQRAIAARPQMEEAHWNASLLLLGRGDMEAGWREYEWRRRIESICPRRQFQQPEWTGQALSGERVFLHIEQAFGDVIQFARYATKVAERGGRVLLQSPPELARILGSVAGVEEIIPTTAARPDFEFHCPLLSLGRIFSPSVEQIPGQVPYLHAEPQIVQRWRQRLEPYRDQFKVGLAWSGRQMLMDGGNRSIATPLLAPLAGIDRTTFFTVQPDNPDIGQAPAGMRIVDWSAELRDFADTAGLMMNLDLIVSIDTAAAHLAGAMGLRTWTMLLFDADWRWLREREDSPWYPTMRLFRQRSAGEWVPVVERLARELKREVK